jgi:hypothetical protein
VARHHLGTDGNVPTFPFRKFAHGTYRSVNSTAVPVRIASICWTTAVVPRQILRDQYERIARHRHQADRGRDKARLELLRETDDPIQRHFTHALQPRRDHEQQKNEVCRIGVSEALNVLRSIVRMTTDVFGTANERLTAVTTQVTSSCRC